MAERLFITQRAYSDIENNKTKLDLDRLENLGEIFDLNPLDILTFDEKQVFNNCSLSASANNYSTINFQDNFENERQSYQQQIKHLEEEVVFLRTLIKNK